MQADRQADGSTDTQMHRLIVSEIKKGRASGAERSGEERRRRTWVERAREKERWIER